MDDDGDMAEMYLTEKKQRAEAYALGDLYLQNNISGETRVLSNSAPVSPVTSISGLQKLQRTFSSIVTSSKHGSLTGSSTNEEKVVQLEMLLEAYFVAIDNTLSKLLSVFQVLIECLVAKSQFLHLLTNVIDLFLGLIITQGRASEEKDE